MRTGADDATPFILRSSFLSSFAAVTQSLGLDPHRLLANAGLDPECLTRDDMRLSWLKVASLIEQTALEAGAGDFGLRLALTRGLPDIGPLLLLLREEPDLRGALRSLQSYIHLHSRTIAIVLEEHEEFPILNTHLVLPPGLRLAPQTTELALCSILQMLRWLIDGNWSPVAVCFSHSAPADRSLHNKVFGCPVEFGHGTEGLVFRKADLQRPISHNSPLLRRHAEHYIRALDSDAQTALPANVTDLIAAMLPSGRCSSRRVAHHLNMDRTTLNRKLSITGQSYSSILQDVREDLAEKFCGANWPLVNVADQLGFSSISVFSRWFRHSYGTTPSSWRKARKHRAAA